MIKRMIISLSLSLALGADAADYYWSGTGTWDTTTASWGTSSGGPYNVAWPNGASDVAIFEGSAGVVTINQNITFSDFVIILTSQHV